MTAGTMENQAPVSMTSMLDSLCPRKRNDWAKGEADLCIALWADRRAKRKSNLSNADWTSIAMELNGRFGGARTSRSVQQKMGNLKREYRRQRKLRADGKEGKSVWVHYDALHAAICVLGVSALEGIDDGKHVANGARGGEGFDDEESNDDVQEVDSRGRGMVVGNSSYGKMSMPLVVRGSPEHKTKNIMRKRKEQPELAVLMQRVGELLDGQVKEKRQKQDYHDERIRLEREKFAFEKEVSDKKNMQEGEKLAIQKLEAENRKAELRIQAMQLELELARLKEKEKGSDT